MNAKFQRPLSFFLILTIVLTLIGATGFAPAFGQANKSASFVGLHLPAPSGVATVTVSNCSTASGAAERLVDVITAAAAG